jgi:hypothetical protein
LTVTIPPVQKDSRPQIDCSKVVSIQDKWHGVCMNLNTHEVTTERPVIK